MGLPRLLRKLPLDHLGLLHAARRSPLRHRTPPPFSRTAGRCGGNRAGGIRTKTMSHFLDRLTFFKRAVDTVLRTGTALQPTKTGVGRTAIASAGSTTRSCAPRMAPTAPALARGRSTSRAASSPGRPSRPTIRARARSCRTTSRAAAHAARATPGICIPAIA